jgi:hypothetical protein
MENSGSLIERFDSIMERYGQTSAMEIVTSLSRIIDDRLNEELQSISMNTSLLLRKRRNLKINM